MNVFVVGGTGLIGYHATVELIRRGHSASVLAKDLPADDLFPAEVTFTQADLHELSDVKVRELLRGHDSLVFAIGADDRMVPKKPADEFFYQENVASTERLLRLAVESGVCRTVVCGSYFTYFDRIRPEWNLRARHPYVRSRLEQAAVAFETSGESMAVCVLELPYVFGSMSGRRPLWVPLLDYLRMPIPTFYPPGGSTMTSVRSVAEAIAGGLENGVNGSYPVGDENLEWTEMIKRFHQLMGIKGKRIVKVPKWFAKCLASLVSIRAFMRGQEHGLAPIKFMDVHCNRAFIELDELADSHATLQYVGDNLMEAIRATVVAVPPRRYRTGLAQRLHQLHGRLIDFALARLKRRT